MDNNPKHAELMRSLTAAQAALWDVIDNPKDSNAKIMLSVITARISRLSFEITKLRHMEG